MSRQSALIRLLYVVPLFVINYLGSFVTAFVFVPLAVVNWLYQVATGNPGFFEGWITRWFAWLVGNTVFVLTSGGEWNWLP